MALLLGLISGSKTCRAKFIPAKETTETQSAVFRRFSQSVMVMRANYMAWIDESNREPRECADSARRTKHLSKGKRWDTVSSPDPGGYENGGYFITALLIFAYDK
jgi:hypothetical protein